MFKRATFIKSVYKIEDLPPPEYPEIAILGRSNAGKSSLINVLLNQKKLARVSSTPGFTQSLNFYLVDNKFYFVDLPGYGFAKVKKDMQKQWKILIERYLTSVRDFKILLLIFDIRRKPDHLDRALIDFVSALKLPYAIILNKSDLLSPKEIIQQRELYTKELSLPSTCEIFVISSKEKTGIEPLKAFLKKLLVL